MPTSAQVGLIYTLRALGTTASIASVRNLFNTPIQGGSYRTMKSQVLAGLRVVADRLAAELGTDGLESDTVVYAACNGKLAGSEYLWGNLSLAYESPHVSPQARVTVFGGATRQRTILEGAKHGLFTARHRRRLGISLDLLSREGLSGGKNATESVVGTLGEFAEEYLQARRWTDKAMLACSCVRAWYGRARDDLLADFAIAALRYVASSGNPVRGRFAARDSGQDEYSPPVGYRGYSSPPPPAAIIRGLVNQGQAATAIRASCLHTELLEDAVDYLEESSGGGWDEPDIWKKVKNARDQPGVE